MGVASGLFCCFNLLSVLSFFRSWNTSVQGFSMGQTPLITATPSSGTQIRPALTWQHWISQIFFLKGASLPFSHIFTRSKNTLNIISPMSLLGLCENKLSIMQQVSAYLQKNSKLKKNHNLLQVRWQLKVKREWFVYPCFLPMRFLAPFPRPQSAIWEALLRALV